MNDFDALAVSLEEANRSLWWQRADLAAYAEETGQKRHLANLWGCSTTPITALAELAREVPPEWRLDDIPKKVFTSSVAIAKGHRAANSTKPWRCVTVNWIRLAHRFGWHQRQLKDAADVARGRRRSRVAWIQCQADVPAKPHVNSEGDVVAEFTLIDFEPSGETPQRVELRAYEVLQE